MTWALTGLLAAALFALVGVVVALAITLSRSVETKLTDGLAYVETKIDAKADLLAEKLDRIERKLDGHGGEAA